MNNQDLLDLTAHGVTLLRIDEAAWQAIEGSRRHGARFSLNFPHATARSGQRDSLVLVQTPQPASLRLGVITSINATSTLDSRVVFDLVSPISPATIESLSASLIASAEHKGAQRLASDSRSFLPISKRLGERLLSRVATEPANGPALSRILTHLRRPRRINDARALQRDAVSMALKMFGAESEPTYVALPGPETALGVVRLREDTVIEHDARWLPGWTLRKSDLTGRAVFEKGAERLDIFTANRQPLEALFGVDLIYFNLRRRALVMVQYKMLEPSARTRRSLTAGNMAEEETEGQDWIARLDDQFLDEIERMRRFDRDLAPQGEYRLNSGAFYLKFVRRFARANAAGLLLSFGHLEQLLEEGRLAGRQGGLRLDYGSLEGHYLRGEPFVELVRSGYIGTRDATTDHLQALAEAALRGDRAVVAAFQRPS